MLCVGLVMGYVLDFFSLMRWTSLIFAKGLRFYEMLCVRLLFELVCYVFANDMMFSTMLCKDNW